MATKTKGKVTSDSMDDIWVGDLECTGNHDYIIDGYVRCYLWSVRNLSMTVEYHGDDMASLIETIREKKIHQLWFHNLAYDGAFILDWCKKNGFDVRSKTQQKGKLTYDHIVTPTKQWMELKLMFGDRVCSIRDSLKKFPGMSLQDIADMMGEPGKSDLDVHKRRDPSYRASEEDIERVQGDTRILALAMAMQYREGMKKMTMASEALHMFKLSLAATDGKMPADTRENNLDGEKKFRKLFPVLTREQDAWLRSGYTGGWTFVNPKHEGKEIEGINVFDENSMYPDKMYNYRLPYGLPKMRPPRGDELYVVKFWCMFKLRKGKFPCIQKKGGLYTSETEFLTDSKGELMEMTLTQPCYELFQECYDTMGTEEGHQYMSFSSIDGRKVFGTYIDHWMGQKAYYSKPETYDMAKRTLAKLYLNSLYGKFAENPMREEVDSIIDEDGRLKFVTGEEYEVDDEMKKYLPLGMFVTGWARQQIVHLANECGDDFVYADTDSIHCRNGDRVAELFDLDDARLGAWKRELNHHDFDVPVYGRYVRSKTYVHYTYEDGIQKAIPIEWEVMRDSDGRALKTDKGKVKTDKTKPIGFDLKACGAPRACKADMLKDLTKFKKGAVFEGKLMRKVVPGGVALVETSFRINI